MSRRVVVLAPEPIRPRMAGMGIRALELARALQAEYDVCLLVSNDPEEARAVAGGVPVQTAPAGALAAAAKGAHAAVVSGHAANWWFHQAPGVPVAVDLYDPFFVENLHYAPVLGEQTARHDRATLALALARGDFYLCASPEQRLFYAGALYAAGRVGARNFPGDPQLASLIAEVPFGAPAEPASGDPGQGRSAAGLPAGGPVVLFGGVYDWYDPEILLAAWPAVLEKHSDAKLLFFENPNPESTPQKVYARLLERARAIDPGGRSVFFSPWLPYASRADLYAAADLVVSISSPGLETDLAFRTRLLDAAWGGVPSVSVNGGAIARALEEAGAGLRAGPAAASIAASVSAFLSDGARRRSAGEAARRFAAERAWGRVAAPLVSWCRVARVDPGRLPFPAAPGRSVWRRLTGR
ncbi:MAG: glycosyltransferase [Acidobacteria bacterium]|nr:glycosyltransferase [Acidobacteriota bacterium]